MRRTEGAILFNAATTRAPLALDPSAFGVFFFFCDPDPNVTEDGVTIVSIDGPLSHKGGFTDSYGAIQARFAEALAAEETKAVVLRIDSPGGECAGLFECVTAMRKLKEASGKPVYAYADEQACSAAYALACVADEIYAPASAALGSVGVISVAFDRSVANEKEGYRFEIITSGARKADFNPNVPISKEAVGVAQAQVDTLAMMFFDMVAAARGTKSQAIAKLEAGVFMGGEAVMSGLSDGVMSLADVKASARELFEESAKSPLDSHPPNKSGAHVMNLIALQKAVSDAKAALAAASTEEEKKIARGSVNAATAALAAAKDDENCEDETEDEEADGESAEFGEDEDEEDDEDAEAEGEDEKATAEGLLQLCRELTGKKSLATVMGALRAMHGNGSKMADMATQIKRLTNDARRGKVDKLVSAATREGKITPAQKDWARSYGMRDLKGFRAFLDAAAPRVQVAGADDVLSPPTSPTPSGKAATLTDAEKKMARAMGITETAFSAQKTKLGGSGVVDMTETH